MCFPSYGFDRFLSLYGIRMWYSPLPQGVPRQDLLDGGLRHVPLSGLDVLTSLNDHALLSDDRPIEANLLSSRGRRGVAEPGTGVGRRRSLR